MSALRAGLASLALVFIVFCVVLYIRDLNLKTEGRIAEQRSQSLEAKGDLEAVRENLVKAQDELGKLGKFHDILSQVLASANARTHSRACMHACTQTKEVKEKEKATAEIEVADAEARFGKGLTAEEVEVLKRTFLEEFDDLDQKHRAASEKLGASIEATTTDLTAERELISNITQRVAEIDTQVQLRRLSARACACAWRAHACRCN